jgi:hypothetical protein
MMKTKIINTCLLLLAILVSGSCKKKLDFTYDNRITRQPVAASSIRLVNLVAATDLSVNGQPLTSYIPPGKDGSYGPDQTKGTVYFPETGRLGTTFYIPQSFVNPDGWADSIVFSSFLGLPASRPYRAKDDFNHPHDYYYVRFRPNMGANVDSLFDIPRSVSPPTDPASFKVRLLNLSSTSNGYSVPGLFRKGPMSLVWSDGTMIPGLAGIAPGAYSDYVEIPFGSYQFKVLDNNGREVQANSSLVLNPATGTVMDSYGTPGPGGRSDTWLTYAPFKTFQPGGVYTIAISSSYDCVITTGNPNGETVTTEANTYRIIADISEPVNLTYGRIQAINAMPGKEVSWQVNGVALGDVLSFSQQTGYGRYVTGSNIVQALDKNGVVLASINLTLQPGDNLTAWLYADKSGAPAIVPVANNMSAIYYNDNASEDGSYSMYKDGYPFWIRFINLCPALDEVTFTTDNGQLFPVNPGTYVTSATQHILFGKAVTQDPYAQLIINAPGKVLAYASKPGVLPGDWLQQITTLKSSDFIANPGLYKSTPLPNREPGIYTVAMVGNSLSTARMIIVKHNQ